MAVKKISQTKAILDYLKSGKPLTTIQATRMFGCTRLPNHIAELKKKGYHFDEVWETNTTRYGTTTRYKTYRMVDEERLLNEENTNQILS